MQLSQSSDLINEQGSCFSVGRLACTEIVRSNQRFELVQQVVPVDHQSAGKGMEQAICKVLSGGNGWRHLVVAMVVLVVNDHGLPVEQLIGLFAYGQAPCFSQHSAFQRFFMALQSIHVVQGLERQDQLAKLGSLRLDRGLIQPGLSQFNMRGQRSDFAGQLGEWAQGLFLRIYQRCMQSTGFGKFFSHLMPGAKAFVLSLTGHGDHKKCSQSDCC